MLRMIFEDESGNSFPEAVYVLIRKTSQLLAGIELVVLMNWVRLLSILMSRYTSEPLSCSVES